MSSVQLISAIAVLLVASGAPGPVLAAGPVGVNMKPGVWEISTAIEASDSAIKRTVTSRICYSNDDVAALARVLPPQRGNSMKCLAQDVKAIDASNGTWKLNCKGKDATFTGAASIKTQGTTYTSQADLEAKVGSKSVRMSEKTTGRWLEPCH